MKARRDFRQFVHRHSLSLASAGVVILWTVLYSVSDPSSHAGAFFGNAIADWTGVVVTVLMTKHLYERGSPESKQPRRNAVHSGTVELLREHSLTIFLAVTGAAWIVAFAVMDANSRWGQVVGNIVSEWTQILGMVLITKRLIEVGSKTQ
jgi:hypothetical protein